MIDERTFPDVEFVETSTEKIVTELINSYETEFGRQLYPADPIYQLILWFASIISQERSLINIAAKRNLLRYADGKYLDSLADLYKGVTRREAEAAATTIRFTVASESPDVVIPSGTIVTVDGTINFATNENIVILAGDMSGEVEATCTTAGTIGNGYQTGSINSLVDQIANITTAENTRESSGGLDRESDSSFYNRLRESNEGYSTAGTAGAYKYYATNCNDHVKDVFVNNGGPGKTIITILMDSGVPSEEEIAEMQTYLEDEDIRATTDNIIVQQPEVVPFRIKFTYYGDERPAVGGTELSELVEAATEQYVQWQTGKLGRRINPGRLISLVIQAGADRVEIEQPTSQELEKTSCSILEGEPEIIYGGDDE
jgi:phage-related baseplate assembly protein